MKSFFSENLYLNILLNHEKKKLPARSKYRWKDNNKMDCKEVSCNTLTCIGMDHKNSIVNLVNAEIIFNRRSRLPDFKTVDT
jgi:hypothetical protein